MDPSNISDEEMEKKREAVGKGCFMLLSLFSTAAFICGMYANAYCDFAHREVVFSPDFDLATACSELDFTDTVLESACTTLFSEHGVGFYGWYGTVPVDQQVCFAYTLSIPNVGYITPEFDTKFNSARAFAITANVLGAFAWFTIHLASCCKLDQAKLNGMTFYFFAACLFQGLTLLIFRSEICEPDFFAQYFPNQELDGVVEDVTCSLGVGAKLAISATVLYFVCNSITPLCIVPNPIGYNRAPAEEAQAEEAPATEEPSAVPAAKSETEEA
jgi:hypothetical protein